jgi:hypothetical protein
MLQLRFTAPALYLSAGGQPGLLRWLTSVLRMQFLPRSHSSPWGNGIFAVQLYLTSHQGSVARG